MSCHLSNQLAQLQSFFERGLLPYSDPLLALLKSLIFSIAKAAKKIDNLSNI